MFEEFCSGFPPGDLASTTLPLTCLFVGEMVSSFYFLSSDFDPFRLLKSLLAASGVERHGFAICCPLLS